MSTFAEVFDQPYKRTVNGKSHSIPPFTTRDFLPWLEELTEARKKEETARIPQLAAAKDKAAMLRAIASIDLTPDHLVSLIETPRGTIKILEMAADKLGIKDPVEVAAFVDGGSPRQNMIDAYRISRLVDSDWLDSRFPPSTPTMLRQLIEAIDGGDEATLLTLAKQCVADHKAAIEEAKKAEAVPNEQPPT